MKKKPKGAQFKHLTALERLIYYQRRIGKKRIRFSTKTNDWEEASSVARLYEEKKGIGRPGCVIVESPTLRDFATRYLEQDAAAALAPSTLASQTYHLSENGPILPMLGGRRLDEISRAILHEWWIAITQIEIEIKKTNRFRSKKT